MDCSHLRGEHNFKMILRLYSFDHREHKVKRGFIGVFNARSRVRDLRQ